jgi:hypothetical protein
MLLFSVSVLTSQASLHVERLRCSIHPCLNIAPIVILSSNDVMGELQT